jgi:hypothetical protein
MERPYMDAWKRYLTEQAKPTTTSKTGTPGKTGTTSTVGTTTKPTTINLFKDPADHISFDTGIIKYPKELSKLIKSPKGDYVEFMVATNNSGDVILRWFPKDPDTLHRYGITDDRPTGQLLFNKNICKDLKKRHIKPRYNSNATYAQNTGQPGQSDTVA